MGNRGGVGLIGHVIGNNDDSHDILNMVRRSIDAQVKKPPDTENQPFWLKLKNNGRRQRDARKAAFLLFVQFIIKSVKLVFQLLIPLRLDRSGHFMLQFELQAADRVVEGFHCNQVVGRGNVETRSALN